MSVTYSINNDSSFESTRKVDINSVLQSIPNNTQKLIRPRDVRDGFLTSWSNSAFKLTSPQNSNLQYIGLDSGNPENRDIKNKILIGKRNFGNIDVMNNQLLNSNTDIFFYNTKDDSIDNQSSTKIGILAGTQSHIDAPYFESFATASQFNLNIVNPSGGDISIKSTTGNVFLNDIPFPKVGEDPDDGDVLKYSGIYPLGKLEWSKPDTAVTSTIGTVGQETNIFGSAVSLNGFSLEFIDDRLVPEDIGGIEQGSSFSTGSFNGQNWPLSEMIRKIIYPYIPPKLDLIVTNQDTGMSYGDIGFTSSVDILHTITTFARESSEDLFDITLNLNSFIYATFSDFSDIPGSLTSSTIQDEFGPTQSLDFELSVSNIIDGITFSTIATFSYQFVRPFISLVIPELEDNLDNLDVVNGGSASSEFLEDFIQSQPSIEFSKSLYPQQDIITIKSNIGASASYLYFAYPNDYGELSGVKSISNGLISVDAFTFSDTPTTISNPSSYGDYIIYKSLSPVIVSSGLEKFELIFDGNLISSGFNINDFWNTTGTQSIIETNNSEFNLSTQTIRMNYISSNSNDYEGVLSNLNIGSIIRITNSSESINYVVDDDPDLVTGSINIPVSAITIGATSSVSPVNDKIQFILLI